MIQRISSCVSSFLSVYSTIIYRTVQAYWFLFYSIAISFIIYITFYQCYLPVSHHVKPLYFQYDSNCDRNIGDALCSFPRVSTVLHDSFERAKDGTRVLTRGQGYNMYLELVLPLTPNNKHLGMFMTKIDIIAKDNSVITSSSRSTMLSAQDSHVATLSTMMKLLPLLLGVIEEQELLVVPLMENYVDDSYTPAIRVNVTILSKHLHFYSANLCIVAVFSGMRYYMHNWPFVFSLFGFPIVLFLVSVISLLRVSNRSAQVRSSRVGHLNSSPVTVENVNSSTARETAEGSDEQHEEIEEEHEDVGETYHKVYDGDDHDGQWENW